MLDKVDIERIKTVFELNKAMRKNFEADYLNRGNGAMASQERITHAVIADLERELVSVLEIGDKY